MDLARNNASECQDNIGELGGGENPGLWLSISTVTHQQGGSGGSGAGQGGGKTHSLSGE